MIAIRTRIEGLEDTVNYYGLDRVSVRKYENGYTQIGLATDSFTLLVGDIVSEEDRYVEPAFLIVRNIQDDGLFDFVQMFYTFDEAFFYLVHLRELEIANYHEII